MSRPPLPRAWKARHRREGVEITERESLGIERQEADDAQSKRAVILSTLLSREQMAEGMIKWFHSVLGCGAIAPDDGSPVVLVDATEVAAAGISRPSKGDRLGYEAVRAASGRLWATNLHAASRAARLP